MNKASYRRLLQLLRPNLEDMSVMVGRFYAMIKYSISVSQGGLGPRR